MGDQDERVPARQGRRGSTGYEPPRVEQVLTPAQLEREILYAGPTASPSGDN